MHEPIGRVHFVDFEKFTSAYLFQIAREKSCDYLLIIYAKNISTATNFDTARVFSSINWLAETDYYLCQIQTFSRPTLSKSFSLELGNVQGLILFGHDHQPVKDNSVYNNQQSKYFKFILDFESSAFTRSIYKKYVLPFWNQENASNSQRWKTLAKVFSTTVHHCLFLRPHHSWIHGEIF